MKMHHKFLIWFVLYNFLFLYFLKLNLNTAPAVFHFPAKGARRPQVQKNFFNFLLNCL